MNLLVKNLPHHITNQDLKELFLAYGTVESAQVIIDRFNGYSRGFGFVKMINDEEARKAINALNEATAFGNTLKVEQTRERESKLK
jgi:RNA recognition motif-containing protein